MKDRPEARDLVAGRGAGADQRDLRGVLERRSADALGGLQPRDPGAGRHDPGTPVRSRHRAAGAVPDLHPRRRLGDLQSRHPRRRLPAARPGRRLHGREHRLSSRARAQVPGRSRGLRGGGALDRRPWRGLGDRPRPPCARRRQRRRQSRARDAAQPARCRRRPVARRAPDLRRLRAPTPTRPRMRHTATAATSFRTTTCAGSGTTT